MQSGWNLGTPDTFLSSPTKCLAAIRSLTFSAGSAHLPSFTRAFVFLPSSRHGCTPELGRRNQGSTHACPFFCIRFDTTIHKSENNQQHLILSNEVLQKCTIAYCFQQAAGKRILSLQVHIILRVYLSTQEHHNRFYIVCILPHGTGLHYNNNT